MVPIAVVLKISADPGGPAPPTVMWFGLLQRPKCASTPVVLQSTAQVPAVPYVSQWWYLRNLGVVFAVSVVLLFIAFRIFGRLEDNFAENI